MPLPPSESFWGIQRLAKKPGQLATPDTLKSLALLLADALSAPDYRSRGPGRDYPNHRTGYRERLYHPQIVERSSSRWAAEAVSANALLNEAASSANPETAIDSAVVSLFLRQIGADEKVAVQWKAKPEAVRSAISNEWLVPLKALNETVGAMAPLYPEQRPALAKAVNEATQHIVEGDFTQWRATTPTSLAQVAELEAGKLSAWKSPLTTTSKGPNGVELTTREETGPDLLWTTKIGGPSHGHDYGGQALLPLLTNLRTTPIIVDDPRYPTSGAARAYLRLLPLDKGGYQPLPRADAARLSTPRSILGVRGGREHRHCDSQARRCQSQRHEAASESDSLAERSRPRRRAFKPRARASGTCSSRAGASSRPPTL